MSWWGWLLLAVVGELAVGVIVGRALAGCTCRKHAWNPACPVHGRRPR